MSLPFIIFTESHYDPATTRLIKKIAPILRGLGYCCLFSEAPEGTNDRDLVDMLNLTAIRISHAFQAQKHFVDIGHIEPKYSYENKRLRQLSAAYTAKKERATFIASLPALDIKYKAIDLEEGVEPSCEDYMKSEEGVKKRDAKMARAWLTASVPAFGIVGYYHATGIQHEILAKLSLEEAREKFCFIHVFSEPAHDDYEEKLRSGEIIPPLGLTVVNAEDTSEEKIIASILDKIGVPGNPLDCSSSETSSNDSELPGRPLDECVATSGESTTSVEKPSSTSFHGFFSDPTTSDKKQSCQKTHHQITKNVMLEFSNSGSGLVSMWLYLNGVREAGIFVNEKVQQQIISLINTPETLITYLQTREVCGSVIAAFIDSDSHMISP